MYSRERGASCLGLKRRIVEAGLKLKVILPCALLVASPALAAPYAFTPLPAGFTATALNNLGQVAGQAPVVQLADGSVVVGPALYSNRTVTPLAVGPNAPAARVAGINDAGDLVLVGTSGARSSLFAVFGGVVSGFAVPEAQPGVASVASLNSERQIVGSTLVFATDGTATTQGYVSFGGAYTLLAVPGAGTTRPARINDAGQVVGAYTNSQQINPQGFLYDAGTFTTIDVPGAASTMLNGINDAGEVSGIYTDATGAQHGFTEAGGVFSDVTGPDGAAFLGSSVNNQGQLIGAFAGGGLSYLATPVAAAVPEPGSAALLGGVLALGAAVRRRDKPGHSGHAA